MLNEDYKDILLALNAENVDFLIVGAYALAAHGYPRATMDIDIWVMPSPGNSAAVLRALTRFGAYLHDLSQEDLQKDDTIFQIGTAPRRIDIITGASGLRFEDANKTAIRTNFDGIDVKILSLDALIKNKTASGRPKDLVDVEQLKQLLKNRPPE